MPVKNQAKYKREQYSIRIARGLCHRCKERVDDINPFTGVEYTTCLKHRQLAMPQIQFKVGKNMIVNVAIIKFREKCSLCNKDIETKSATAARIWGKNYYFHLDHSFSEIEKFCAEKENERG